MLKKMFIEFFTIGYKPGTKNHYSGVSDFVADDNGEVVMRKTKKGVTFNYINNGNCIYIPWEWIDLFSSFNTHSGNRIFNINNLKDLDEVSAFMYCFVKLITYIDTNNKSYLLPVLAEVCKLRTKIFSSWLKEELGYSLPNITYSTVDKLIII